MQETAPSNFIRHKIDQDLQAGRVKSVVTRFPPEPNGYLHIGHAKSICLNFGLAEQYNGRCHLRFDDTNPTREDTEFVEAIDTDVRWLGFDPAEHVYYASDYFVQLYEWAQQLIKAGKAYVDTQDAEQIRETRGSLTEPGTPSPCREQTVEENLALFERMRAGEFADGACVLRAKIDMAAPNMNMRDPAMYRVRNSAHHRTGDTWKIYPMYDWAHGQSDALEGITHSLCTLEFEDHRPLYNWYLDALDLPQPRPEQTEFARLNLAYTVLSKRKLIQLVEGNHVDGWDDPRMPTISGLRRRGFPPEAIVDFCDRIGVAKADSLVDLDKLHFSVRDKLNKLAERRMAIRDPLKVVITNYPEGSEELLEAKNNQEDPDAGTRQIPFSRTLWIERDDFREEAPRKWFRFAPGKEVRLLHAYYVTCQEVVRDAQGQVVELHCTYDPETKGGWSEDGRKVKGTVHWLSAAHAQKVPIREINTLFTLENMDAVEEGQDWLDYLNPDSVVESEAWVEPALLAATPGSYLQFVRNGYYTPDSALSKPGAPVFNRTVGMRDSWAKQEKKT